MAILFTNNASGLLATGIGLGDTELVLEAGQGLGFPSPSGSDYFVATLEDSGGNIEICHCTSRTDDTLTVTRAQEATAEQVFAAGARVELRVTKEVLESFVQNIAGQTLNLQADVNFNGFELQNANLSPNATLDNNVIWTQGNLSLETLASSDHTHAADYAPLTHTHAAADVDSGTFDDARIAEANVTQHKPVMLRIPNSTQSGATYTLVDGDIGTKIRYTGGAASEFTFPVLTAAIGDVLFISNETSNELTITPSGVTFKARDDVSPLVVSTKNGVVGFNYVASNTWDVVGAYD